MAQIRILKQLVKGNEGRFPKDFMFRVTNEEKHELGRNCDRLPCQEKSSTTTQAFTRYHALVLREENPGSGTVRLNNKPDPIG